MNHRTLLNLVAIPAFTGSMLTPLIMVGAAFASEMTVVASCNSPNVELSNVGLKSSGLKSPAVKLASSEIQMASSNERSGEYPGLDFSAAESDAAIALFGCDCSACIRALHQLQNQTLLDTLNLQPNRREGHCWTALQKRASQEKIQEVLQTLKAND